MDICYFFIEYRINPRTFCLPQMAGDSPAALRLPCTQFDGKAAELLGRGTLLLPPLYAMRININRIYNPFYQFLFEENYD
jgi:hypothetical protein